MGMIALLLFWFAQALQPTLPVMPACPSTDAPVGAIINASQFQLPPNTPNTVKVLPPSALYYIQILCAKKGIAPAHWVFVPLAASPLPTLPALPVLPLNLPVPFVFPTNIPVKPAVP